MTQYSFNVNGQSAIGNVAWNAYGTLQSLAITDPYRGTNTASRDTVSGPISGIITLVATNNLQAAALAANAESAITLGAGAFNSETTADKIANGIDAALTFLGIGQGDCQVP